MPIKRVLVAVTMLTALGCGGSDSNPAGPAGSSGSGGSGSTNTMALTINGAAFNPVVVSAVLFPANGTTPDILSIGATEGLTGTSTTLAFASNAAVGQYTIGGAGASIGTNATLSIITGASGQAWQAVGTLGSGTVTIATRGSNTATGSVNLTLAGTTGTGNKVVVGTFSVKF